MINETLNVLSEEKVLEIFSYPFSCFNLFENDPDFMSWVITEDPLFDDNTMANITDKIKNKGYISSKCTVLFYHEGAPDLDDWLLLLKINDPDICDDPFYLFMKAGCDYTGFDCQGSISFVFSHDLNNMIKLGLTTQDRETLYKFLLQLDK